MRYQDLRAPVDGVVFDMQAKGRGYVANPSEPILKIVPGNGLVAKVFVTNQDIGFVVPALQFSRDTGDGGGVGDDGPTTRDSAGLSDTSI